VFKPRPMVTMGKHYVPEPRRSPPPVETALIDME